MHQPYADRLARAAERQADALERLVACGREIAWATWVAALALLLRGC